jgi:hypothetical protein
VSDPLHVCELCRAEVAVGRRFCSRRCSVEHSRLLKAVMLLRGRGQITGGQALAALVWPSAALLEALLSEMNVISTKVPGDIEILERDDGQTVLAIRDAA